MTGRTKRDLAEWLLYYCCQWSWTGLMACPVCGRGFYGPDTVGMECHLHRHMKAELQEAVLEGMMCQ